MKKFIFLYQGAAQPTPEVMESWTNWFKTFEDKIVDSGNPFGPGLEVKKDGSTNQLPQDAQAISGYTIINVENMDEAEKIAKTSPVITSVRVYEAMAM